MFRRERHRAMMTILDALDVVLIDQAHFVFAGGSRISMDNGEPRESLDLDFLCSDAEGYASLRSTARERGYAGLFLNAPELLSFPREIRADQYGIRFPVQVADLSIRVEFVREGRITLGAPARPAWSPVPCLSTDDCYTEKLLACSDRGADRDELSRDLVDLAILRVHRGAIPEASWNAAMRAYGESVQTDLRRAIDAFSRDDIYQSRCFTGLRVDDPAPVRLGVGLLSAETLTRARTS